MATLDTVQETEAKPPQNKRGHPKKGEIKNIDQATRFFEVIKRIPADAWTEGKAIIKIYRQEPSIDRLASGKAKHIQEYYEPIAGPERIKLDHGSGKYLLFLTYQGPKDSQVREVERTNIDILDMKYPPKVPRGDWLDEPKNSGWLWAFPKEAPPPAVSPVSQLAETLDVLDGIQDRAAARSKPADSPAQPSLLEVIRTVKEIMPPPPPPATENKMLETIMTMMNGQLDRMERSNQELRKEIADSRKNPEAPKSPLGNLTEMMAEAQKIGLLPEGGLKSLWADAKGLVQDVRRSRMSGTEEFLQPIMVGLLEAVKPSLPVLVTRLFQQRAPQQPQPAAAITAANPAPAPAPVANGAPPVDGIDPQTALAFFGTFADPFIRFFKDGDTGDAFAEWIYEGHGAHWQGVKWLHLKTMVGLERIVIGFKNMPLWPEIASAEERFTAFTKQFIDWAPALEAEPDEVEPDGPALEPTEVYK